MLKGLLLLSLILLSACSSNLRKGDAMMEMEQYTEAVHFYELAFAKSPHDEKVVAKLAEARSEMIADTLIKVRMFRQSQQMEKASTLLNESLEKINQWKIRAGSGVKATINEEIIYSSSWLLHRLIALGEEQSYNRFFYHLKQYNHILQSGLADDAIKKYKPTMQQYGQQQCHSNKSLLNDQSHFQTDVWRNYCGVFGLMVTHELKRDTSRFSKPLFMSQELRLSREMNISNKNFLEKLNKKIEKHPWFSEKSTTPLAFNISGHISYQKRITPHTFTKKYTVKDRRYQVVKDPQNPKKVINKLLQVNSIEKQSRFKGFQYKETVFHHLQISSHIHDYKISANEQSASKTKISYGHSVYFKQAGISPRTPKLMDVNQWFLTIGNNSSNQVKQALDKSWVKTYCNNLIHLQPLNQYEKAARCRILSPQHPIVAGWSQTVYQLQPDELQILLR